MKQVYLVTGLTGFLLCLIAFTPAPLLYHWSRGMLSPQAQLYGLRGNLWQGGAAGANLGGVRLQAVEWQLRPLSLLFLRLSHRVTAQTDGDRIETVVSRTPLGTLRVANLDGSLPLEQLGPSLRLPILPVSGRMQLHLKQLKFRKTKLVEAEGGVDFNNLSFSFSSPPAALGNYRGEFTTAQQTIQLAIASQGSGPLEATGSAEIKSDGQYTLDLKLRPRATAAASVVSLVQSLGQPDAEGWYHLRQAGSY